MSNIATNLRNIFLYQMFSVTVLVFIMSNAANAKNLVYENNWAYLADTVMGGVSRGGAEFAAGALRLTGQVSTKNNGGFIQSRVGLNIKAKDFNGIRIKVRGNNNEYFVHLRAPRMLPWNYYYAEFYASSDWEIIDIPLSSFKYSRNQNDNLNSKVIRSIGIVAYGKDFSAQLDLANIELY